MNALQFTYINHRGDTHEYLVIPVSVEFTDNKLNYAHPYKLSWNLKAFVLERSGEPRNVIRTFSLIRIKNPREIPLETR